MWLIILILSKSSLSKELNFDVGGTGFIFSIGKGISVEKLLQMLFVVAALCYSPFCSGCIAAFTVQKKRVAKSHSALVYSNGSGVNLHFLSFVSDFLFRMASLIKTLMLMIMAMF